MAATAATPTGPVEHLGPLRAPRRSWGVGGSSTWRRTIHVTGALRSHGSRGPASPHLVKRPNQLKPLHAPSPKPHDSYPSEPIIACVSTESHPGAEFAKSHRCGS